MNLPFIELLGDVVDTEMVHVISSEYAKRRHGSSRFTIFNADPLKLKEGLAHERLLQRGELPKLASKLARLRLSVSLPVEEEVRSLSLTGITAQRGRRRERCSGVRGAWHNEVRGRRGARLHLASRSHAFSGEGRRGSARLAS